MARIRSHFELQVYQLARALAIKVSGIVKNLPASERFDLVQQWLRAARSVCTNIAEAWRKRRYPASFVAKLNDAEGEAAESQTWADLAEGSGYISKEMRDEIVGDYDALLGQLVTMANDTSKWTVRDTPKVRSHSPKVPESPGPRIPQSPSPDVP